MQYQEMLDCSHIPLPMMIGMRAIQKATLASAYTGSRKTLVKLAVVDLCLAHWYTASLLRYTQPIRCDVARWYLMSVVLRVVLVPCQ